MKWQKQWILAAPGPKGWKSEPRVAGQQEDIEENCQRTVDSELIPPGLCIPAQGLS